MKWQDKLTDREREELEQARLSRDAAKSVYNSIVRKLKSRCESRLRAERGNPDDAQRL